MKKVQISSYVEKELNKFKEGHTSDEYVEAVIQSPALDQLDETYRLYSNLATGRIDTLLRIWKGDYVLESQWAVRVPFADGDYFYCKNKGKINFRIQTNKKFTEDMLFTQAELDRYGFSKPVELDTVLNNRCEEQEEETPLAKLFRESGWLDKHPEYTHSISDSVSNLDSRVTALEEHPVNKSLSNIAKAANTAFKGIGQAIGGNIEEEWKPVAKYEQYYAVSSKGQIKSLNRNIAGRGGSTILRKGRILKPQKPNKNSYLVIALFGEDHRKIIYRVDMLVLEAFTGVEYRQIKAVNHLDGDRLNNSLENLEAIVW